MQHWAYYKLYRRAQKKEDRRSIHEKAVSDSTLSAGCSALAALMLVLDVVNHNNSLSEGHGLFIITMLLIAAALELIRSELVSLHQKLEDK